MTTATKMKVALFEVYMDEEIRKAVVKVLDSGWYTLGEQLKTFESRFSRYVGTKFAVGVNSGTAAIHATLLALGIGRGDEIIVPSHTAFPTVEPVIWCNGKPVFADIDAETYTIDASSVRKNITKKTKAIIGVHLYGHSVNLDEIQEICNSNGITLIEDCAQAAGAEFKGRMVGSIGRVGCFSFYPTKNMTVCGEGGMVTTDDEELSRKIQLIRHHGMEDRYNHVLVGHNFRLAEVPAAIGIKQLERLDQFNSLRRKWAKLYREFLRSSPIILPAEASWSYHVYHLFVIRAKKRDELLNYLGKNGIGAAIHYPIPCHLQKAIPSHLRTTLPKTEQIVKDIISLPMHPRLTEEAVQYVAEHVAKFLTRV